MGPSLELDWLEDFLEVASQRNFTRAAEARGLSQSSLSRRIQSLELWLGGARLFDRHTTPLQLTRAGEAFKSDATQIVLAMRHAHQEVVQNLGGHIIPIYTLETLAATFLPRVLRTIRDVVQDTNFDIQTALMTGDLSDCVEAVAYGATPFMVVYENPRNRVIAPSDVSSDRLESVTIARDRLIPVCGLNSYELYQEMLSGGAQIPFSSYPEGSFLRKLQDQKIRELDKKHKRLRLGTHLRTVDVAPMADTLRNLAREDQGLAWVLHSTAEKALGPEIRVFDFGVGAESHIELEIVLFRNKAYSSASIDRFTLERVWKAAQQLEALLSPDSKDLASFAGPPPPALSEDLS